ncbi:MAG: hypothetical protein ACWGPN_06535 [Gammaproteobacteria bacterium]|jgi:hypothetical protein
MSASDEAQRRRKARINAVKLALISLAFYAAFIVAQLYRGQ